MSKVSRKNDRNTAEQIKGIQKQNIQILNGLLLTSPMDEDGKTTLRAWMAMINMFIAKGAGLPGNDVLHYVDKNDNPVHTLAPILPGAMQSQLASYLNNNQQ